MTDRHDPSDAAHFEDIFEMAPDSACVEGQSREPGRGSVEIGLEGTRLLSVKAGDAPKAMHRAVGYCRVGTNSGEHRDDCVSEQRTAFEDYCARRGWLLIGVYIEKATGAAVGQRPVFQAMMNDSAQTPRQFDHIIAYSPSRMSRDAAAADSCLNVLQDRGIDMLFVQQPGVGLLQERISAAFSQQRSREEHRALVELARIAARALAPVKP